MRAPAGEEPSKACSANPRKVSEAGREKPREMARKKKKTFEGSRPWKLEVDLGNELQMRACSKGCWAMWCVPEAAIPGLLITSDRGQTRTHLYRVDPAAEQALRPLMEAAVQG